MHFLKYTHSRPGAESAPSRSRKERGSPGAIAQVVGQSGFPGLPNPEVLYPSFSFRTYSYFGWGLGGIYDLIELHLDDAKVDQDQKAIRTYVDARLLGNGFIITHVSETDYYGWLHIPEKAHPSEALVLPTYNQGYSELGSSHKCGESYRVWLHDKTRRRRGSQ